MGVYIDNRIETLTKNWIPVQVWGKLKVLTRKDIVRGNYLPIR